MSVAKPQVRTVRALRFAAVGLGALFLMAATLTLVLPRFLSSETLRRSVAEELANLSGHPVSIAGTSRLVMLPWPTVVLQNVQVGAEEPSDVPVIEAAGVEARLALLPLLRGRTEVRGLTLDRPRIVLRVDADGRSNWRSGTSILSLLVLESGTERAPRIGDLTVRGGSISYRDEQARRRTELVDAEMTISWPSASSRLTASGQFRLRGEEIRFQGALDRPANLFARDISPLDLSIDTPALRAQLGGNVLAGDDIQIEGRLSFTSPSVRDIAGWLVPEARNTPDVGPVQGTARLKILDRTLTLEEARLQVDRSRGEGTLSLTFDRTRTSVQGTVDFDQIDMRPFVNTQLARAADGAGDLRSDSIGPLDVDLRLSADTLLLGRTTIRTAALSLLTREGRMEVSLADGQAFGGRMSARTILENRPQGGVRARMMFGLAGIRTDDALRELFGIIRLSGTGHLNVTLTAEGESIREAAETVAGEASLRLTQGAIVGIDLTTLTRRAERSPVDALLDARGGRTVVEQATATFRIAGLDITTEDALIRGPGYRVLLRGGANGANRTLALNGTLASATADGQRPTFELPFVVRGPWSDPVLVPNPEGLVRRTTPSQTPVPGPSLPALPEPPAPPALPRE